MKLFSNDELSAINEKVIDEENKKETESKSQSEVLQNFINEVSDTYDLFFESMEQYPELAEAHNRRSVRLTYAKYGLFSPSQSEELYYVTHNRFDQYYVTKKGKPVSTRKKSGYINGNYDIEQTYYDKVKALGKTTKVDNYLNNSYLTIYGKEVVLHQYVDYIFRLMATFTYNNWTDEHVYGEFYGWRFDTEKIKTTEERYGAIKEFMISTF